MVDFFRTNFGPDFRWGVSSSAFQSEGAPDQEGKSQSIWDVFTASGGKIRNNQHANLSCDFYNRFEEDLELMKQLHIPNFRFSISWSRIFPEGKGKINPGGVDYYNRIIDKCLELNIEPWITLYHWDLPLQLEYKGGWTNRDIIGWFSGYAAFCINTFGDRVKHWIMLNEPMVFTGAGYFLGVHAPGKKGLKNFLPAVHHAALCQAEGARIAKSVRNDIKVGSTFSCSLVEPSTSSGRDRQAAKRVDALLNRTFLEPLLGLGYPVGDLPLLQGLENYFKQGDEEKLCFEMDFIGLQNYTREIVAHSWFTPLIKARIVTADSRKVKTTAMNWEIYPGSIYSMLKKFGDYKNIPELIVTENGAAFPDTVLNDAVHDPDRTHYLQEYLAQVLRAKNEGIHVNGYFVWSFTDNFEWAEGFTPRFGLVHIDYQTQKRLVKSSGLWYSRFLSTDQKPED